VVSRYVLVRRLKADTESRMSLVPDNAPSRGLAILIASWRRVRKATQRLLARKYPGLRS